MPRGIFPRPTPQERFWTKVRKTQSCWLWTASLDRKGYARFYVDGNDVPVHRFAYELKNGPIPNGLELDHLCRVHNCVNPDHLEAVTHQVNVLRGETLNAENAKKTHCSRGHPYDMFNTYPLPNGGRDCRKCQTIRQRSYRQRKRHRLALS